MRNIVVAMVGSRDVRYKLPLEDKFRLGGSNPRADYPEVVKSLWGRANPDAENLRAISERLLARYRDPDDDSVTNDTLEFPILQPALDYILDHNDRIDILILIVTDQRGIPHSSNDTIHCGELLEKLIQARFGSDRIAAIEKEVFRDPPNESDRMYHTVRSLLQSKVDVDDKLFVLPSSGTPAISAAMTHAGMNLYGPRCKAVQVDQPPSDPTGATPGNAHALTQTPYLMDAVRLGAKELIKHGNYSGALDVLERFGIWPDKLFNLLKHARARVNLHRGGARSHAELITNDEIIDTRLGAALQLPKGRFATLGYTNELRFLIYAALDQERYADALFRIIQFHESCRSIFSIGMLVSDYDRFNEHVMNYLDGKLSTSLTSNRKELEKNLRKITNWKPRQGWWKVGRKAKNAVFDSAVSEARRRCQACQNAKDLIENRVFYNSDNPNRSDLTKVRNRAIHTPSGVSRDIIEKTIRGYVPDESDTEPLEYLKNLLEEIINNLYACFDQIRSENPYPVLQREMLSLLDQEVEL